VFYPPAGQKPRFAFGGNLGGAPLGRAWLRVTLGGALAMAVTALIGRILGVSIG
jgi:VIT1/CCC1 family predicted Fe2+/Mn2+ transporter